MGARSTPVAYERESLYKYLHLILVHSILLPTDMAPLSILWMCPNLPIHQNLNSHLSARLFFLTFAHSSPHLKMHTSSLRKHIQAFSSSPNNPGHSLEESRWLREEKRLLREEQRWLREERRWARERDSLLSEISQLRLQVQALHREGWTEVLKEKNMIPESGSIAKPIVFEEKYEEVVLEEKKVLEEKLVRVVDEGKKVNRNSCGRRTLRVGAEGDEVKTMQEALQKLGFYSGGEDIKYSSFSSGTECAVKAWQASIGVKEDGIMTGELLETLYHGQPQNAKSLLRPDQREYVNGAAVVTQISEYKQPVVKESDKEIEVSQHRVFLLGENRWEEPSRLASIDKQAMNTKASDSTKKCPACRGEGHLICTECDGSGEPNIEEPQFLEWVDEYMKCPYCGGLGYTTCDVCEGKPAVV
ncbi:hypothetical protein SAY87_006037 [Trapa incisa]|uniref:Peptidoglycan binding-like domain-containing protein n=1 Tax=Trapa incisa TaxID=236973 RepID=A0AAN7K9Y1_9MYRT|nr:hypothetical protein SAY87_006037 [Trapa incisa]